MCSGWPRLGVPIGSKGTVSLIVIDHDRNLSTLLAGGIQWCILNDIKPLAHKTPN
jgi:hypothetical protein